MMKKILSHTWLVLVALFMYVPVLILAFYSFTESTAIGAVRGILPAELFDPFYDGRAA